MLAVSHSPVLTSRLAAEKKGPHELSLPSLKVLSYEGPESEGSIAASMAPMLQCLSTKVDWFIACGIAASSSNKLAFRTLPAAKALFDQHNRVCTTYLAPLLSGQTEQLKFDADDWKSFRQFNEVIAAQCLDIAGRSYPTLLWLHDYHVALVGQLIALHAGIILAQFWHAPWPKPEDMLRSPIAAELVEGLLCNRILGFNTNEYAVNFLYTVQALFPNAIVDLSKNEIIRRRSRTGIIVMPLNDDGAADWAASFLREALNK